MREIKFRAWDKINKKMSQGAFSKLFLQPFGDICIQQEDGTLAEVNYDYAIMQYTGLKDKNGKEIYEGDIVNHLFHNEQFKVIWNEKRCSFIALYLGGKDRYSEGVKDKLLQVDNVYYEIIGNIYENPELLDNK